MTDSPPFECGPECPAPDHHGRGPQIEASTMPAPATAAGAPVQGPAAPCVLGPDLGHRPDTAANEDPHSTRAAARWPAAAEQAAFRAAQHLGLDDPDPDAYARELELEAPALEDGW